ncbi:MAG: protein kinase [Planctomycetia bacterium]|nr:protein kinase [Planctomycetia bacterium]
MSLSATIDELLIRWQEQRRLGAPVSVQELCADHPSLAEELARRIEAFESMEALLGLGPHATLSEPGARPSIPRNLAEKLLLLGYELLEVIDQGGMGVVYKANQVKLQRIVALKMIAGFRVGPKQLSRFRVEVEAVARLQHPHIIQIHEVGEVDGHSFFSMEFVEGGTLAHRLATGPLPPLDAAKLLEVLARAIHHAHTRGIVHRDLKPANILLVSAELGARNAEPKSAEPSSEVPSCSALRAPRSALVPKVTDFGLAKRLGTPADHTTTGEVIGTPTYMAPEQAEGKTNAIGPACDVYALGAIFYEALTGRPPFQAKTVLETLRQVIAEEPVAPRRVRAGIPRDLEAICLKCLEKNPAHRYRSAEELANDLHRFLTGVPVVARPLSRVARVFKWARRRPVWIGSMVLVVIAAVVLAGRGYAEREQRRARAVEVAPQAREILHRHCFHCHGANPEKAERGFFVLERESLLDPNRRNVVPGHPDLSRLIQRIEDGSMPPEIKEDELPRVSERELSILKVWIAGGAPPFPPEDPHAPTPPVVPRSELAAEVKAIFLNHCYECHMASKADGGIKILNHDLLVLGRKVVIPGNPDESELYQLITSTNENRVMPPKDQEVRMKPEEIETVRRWIEIGAPPFPRTIKNEK